jgi:hypothetical protein
MDISPYVQRILEEPPKDEIIYYVPNTGHGTTKNLAEAVRWNSLVANRGLIQPVLQRRVQTSAWTVVTSTEEKS